MLKRLFKGKTKTGSQEKITSLYGVLEYGTTGKASFGSLHGSFHKSLETYYYKRHKWSLKLREMRCEPTISLLRTLYITSIISPGFSVEVSDAIEDAGKRDEIAMQANKELQRFVYQLSRDAVCGCVDWGWQAFEVVYEHDDDGRVRLGVAKPLLHELTVIDVYDDDGGFAGVSQGTVTLEEDECLLFCWDTEGTNWYGRPVMGNLEIAYDQKQDIEDRASQYDRRVSTANWIIYYPVGRTQISGFGPDEESVYQVNHEIAIDIINRLESEGHVAVPEKLQAQIDDLDEGEMSWKIEKVSAAGEGSGAPYQERTKYKDIEFARGFGFPERSVFEGQHGTKAEAGTHTETAQVGQEDRGYSLASVITVIIQNIVAWNEGEEYRDAVKAVANPLTDSEYNVYWTIYQQILNNQELSVEQFDALDMDKIAEKLSLPLKSKEEREGDLDDDEPDAEDLELSDCGAGSGAGGGFGKGNTCAKGGGSATKSKASKRFANELQNAFRGKHSFTQAASVAGNTFFNISTDMDRGEFVEHVLVENGFDADEARKERNRIDGNTADFQREEEEENQRLQDRINAKQQEELFDEPEDALAVTTEPVAAEPKTHEFFNFNTGEKDTIDFSTVSADEDSVPLLMDSTIDPQSFATAWIEANPESRPFIEQWQERENNDRRESHEKHKENLATINQGLADRKLPAKEYTAKYGGESRKSRVETFERLKPKVEKLIRNFELLDLKLSGGGDDLELAFCPTGKGGGVDNSCSSKGGSSPLRKSLIGQEKTYIVINRETGDTVGEFPISTLTKLNREKYKPVTVFDQLNSLQSGGDPVEISEEEINDLSLAFCPTGEGGGIDNSCSSKGGPGKGEPLEGGQDDIEAQRNTKHFAWAVERFGDEQKAANFTRWFGDSQVVDGDGNPKVVYHGTDFPENGFSDSPSHYFTHQRDYASRYGKVIKDVYLKVENPLEISWDIDRGPSGEYYQTIDAFSESIEDIDEALADTIRKANDIDEPSDEREPWWFIEQDWFVDSLKSAGYDGVVSVEKGNDIIIALGSSQIKSATDNHGTFKPNENDITLSDCGANSELGTGFVKGNTCAKGQSDIESFKQSLTESEKDILKQWGNSEFGKDAEDGLMNELQDSQRDGTQHPKQAEWSAILDKAPVFEGTVYRGIEKVPTWMIEDMNVGGELKFQFDQSASIVRATAEDFISGVRQDPTDRMDEDDILFTIQSKTGAFLDDTPAFLSQAGNVRDEQEVVARNQTRYKIDRIEKVFFGESENMIYEIDLSEIE